MKKQHHIVIVGAGFAGLMASVRLARQSKKYPMRITLINGSEDYIIRPRLHEWATNQTQDRQKIVDILKGKDVNFVKAWVKELYPQENALSIETDEGVSRIRYDSLILAMGSHIDTTMIEGISDYAYVFDAHAKNGAEALRQKLLDYENKQGKVVVIGGGATGIEGATHIKSLYPHLEVTIVSRDTLGVFKTDSRVEREIQASFAEHKINVLDKSSVQAIHAHYISLEATLVGHHGTGKIMSSEKSVSKQESHLIKKEQTLPFDICVWAGGFRAPALGANAGLEVNAHNQILIDPFQRAVAYPNIIAVGDCAFPIETPGNPYRMCCPVALTMGAHAADNIIRMLARKSEKPLSFDYYGQVMQLGVNDAIAWLTYPNDEVRLIVTRGKVARMARHMILASLDVIFDYEKAYGIYNWTGKNRYQKNESKMITSSKKLSEQRI
ncbi:MAG: FAD-dependent oxidoreductase [Phototrophicaceae bacterium]